MTIQAKCAVCGVDVTHKMIDKAKVDLMCERCAVGAGVDYPIVGGVSRVCRSSGSWISHPTEIARAKAALADTKRQILRWTIHPVDASLDWRLGRYASTRVIIDGKNHHLEVSEVGGTTKVSLLFESPPARWEQWPLDPRSIGAAIRLAVDHLREQCKGVEFACEWANAESASYAPDMGITEDGRIYMRDSRSPPSILPLTLGDLFGESTHGALTIPVGVEVEPPKSGQPEWMPDVLPGIRPIEFTPTEENWIDAAHLAIAMFEHDHDAEIIKRAEGRQGKYDHVSEVMRSRLIAEEVARYCDHAWSIRSRYLARFPTLVVRY